jgi:predicted SAM-dependent methyltransferase
MTKEEVNMPFTGVFHGTLLDLGCGLGDRRRAGATGMDKQIRCSPEILHDIEVLPWPIEDTLFDAAIAWHLFEHLKPWLMIDIMNECHRVLKPNGLLYVGMPSPGSPQFYQDPTHIRTWNKSTPKHFDPDSTQYKFYHPKPWKIEVNTTYKDKNDPDKVAMYFVFRKREL